MIRRGLAQFALSTFVALVPAVMCAAEKPNIVLIVIDDLGQRDLGCYGSTFYKTPNVDRIANEGVRFTDYYAANPVCSPTRSSLQTGRNPARHNLTNFLKGVKQDPKSPVLTAEYVDQLPLAETTLAELLGGAGYQTAFVGKWHLGGEPYWPEHQGYQTNIGGCDAGNPASYFWPAWKKRVPVEGEFEGQYLTELLSRKACEWLADAAKQEQPFFLALCHYTVHTPIEPKDELLKKYQKKLEQNPNPGPQDNPYYAAMVESMDTSIGNVLNTLDKAGVADNTLILFTSDNGGLSVSEGKHTPATNNAPLRSGKGHVYEGGIRVPLVVRWPGVAPAGNECSVPAISDDIFPTLAAAAGITAKTAGPLDGRDLSGLLRKQQTDALQNRTLCWHYPHFANQGSRPSAAIRRGDWKLIQWYETGELELYNLADDISEQRDLSSDKPELAAELREELSAWRKRVKANMPTRNPNYRGSATPVVTR